MGTTAAAAEGIVGSVGIGIGRRRAGGVSAVRPRGGVSSAVVVIGHGGGATEKS